MMDAVSQSSGKQPGIEEELRAKEKHVIGPLKQSLISKTELVCPNLSCYYCCYY